MDLRLVDRPSEVGTPFYCSFRRADFLTVFVCKIGPSLEVCVEILPPLIIMVPTSDEKMVIVG